MSNLSQTLQKIMLYSYMGLLIVMPLTWTTTTSELFEFPKMLLVYAFTVLIATLWLSRMVLERRLILKPTFLDIPLLLFLLSQILSTLFSMDRHTSFYGYYSRFHGGLLSTFSYLTLYYAAVSNLTFKQVKKILIALILTAVIASLYAFPEHFGHSPSCIRVANKFTADCWIQDVQTRVFGTFGQPNWLAAYLITLFFIPLALVISEFTGNKTKPRWWLIMLYSLASILFFAVLLFTKSRSGLAGLALGFIIFWPLTFYLFCHIWKKILWLFLSCLLILISCFLLFGKGAVSQIDTQIAKIMSPTTPASATAATPAKISSGTQLEVGGTESGTIRKIVWTGAIELWKKHPILGSGVETFAYGYYNVRPAAHNMVSEWDFLYNKAHNEYLNFLATTGLFGLLTYLAIIFTYTIWSIKQILSSSLNPKSKIINTSLVSGFWALMVSNFFGFSTVPVGLLFFLFPALAYLLASKESDQDDSESLSLQTPQYISLAVIYLIALYLLTRVLNYYHADLNYAAGKNLTDDGDLAKALTALQKAYGEWPNEPTYTDAYSLAAAKAALSLATNGKLADAKPYADQAITLSDLTLTHNKVHLNFWKTRARVFLALAALDGKYVVPGEQALEQAAVLAPTDAKIWYNLGAIRYQLGDYDTAKKLYQKTLELKPNYDSAKQDLDSILAIEATQAGLPGKSI